MFDSFRGYEAWSEDISAYWTFGGANSTGTYVMTALGVALMIVSIIGWVVMENRKLTAQAERLRAAGMGR